MADVTLGATAPRPTVGLRSRSAERVGHLSQQSRSAPSIASVFATVKTPEQTSVVARELSGPSVTWTTGDVTTWIRWQRKAALSLGSARPVYRATQRKPMWLVEVSIAPGWRAAGR